LGFAVPELNLPRLAQGVSWDVYYEPFLRSAVMQGGATAVLSYSHYAAVALLRTAHDLKLAVPRDFSLVCFNDEPLVRLTVPALTAVNVPSVAMGEAAADLLLAQISDASEPKHLRLDESLVVRESTIPRS
jgi:LacI family transcriptional regulator